MPMSFLDSSPAGLAARIIALDETAAVDWVLKPNLEGGGHNVFGSAIPPYLRSIPESSWEDHILMRLIISPAATLGSLMIAGEDGIYEGPVVSELGILGTCMWRNTGAILRNDVAGWTFKTKILGVEEMSVVKGFGAFDCPELVE